MGIGLGELEKSNSGGPLGGMLNQTFATGFSKALINSLSAGSAEAALEQRQLAMEQCNASGGYFAAGVCHTGQAAIDIATKQAESDTASPEIIDKAKTWLEEHAEEIVNILSETTGLESTVDQGSEIVWQQGDVTDVLGDVQIQIPDFAAILESMGGGDDSSTADSSTADSSTADSSTADSSTAGGAAAGGADVDSGSAGATSQGGFEPNTGSTGTAGGQYVVVGQTEDGKWVVKDTVDGDVWVVEGSYKVGDVIPESDMGAATRGDDSTLDTGTAPKDPVGWIWDAVGKIWNPIYQDDKIPDDAIVSPTSTKPTEPPAAGTVLSSACDGDDRYTVITDGQGGTTTKVDVGGCKTTTDKVTGLLGDFIKAASTDGQKGTGDAGDGTSGGGNDTEDENVAIETKDTEDENVAIETKDTEDENVAIETKDTEDENVAIETKDTEDENVAIETKDTEDENVAIETKDTEDENVAIETKDTEGSNVAIETKDTEGSNVAIETKDTEGSNVAIETKDTEGSNVTTGTKDTEGSNVTTGTKDTEGSNVTTGTKDTENEIVGIDTKDVALATGMLASGRNKKSDFKPFYMDLSYDKYQLTPLSFEQKDYMREITGIIQRNSRGMLT